LKGGGKRERVLGWRSKLAKRLQQNNFAAMIEGGLGYNHSWVCGLGLMGL